jgi:hypothetical protein
MSPFASRREQTGSRIDPSIYFIYQKMAIDTSWASHEEVAGAAEAVESEGT